MNGYYSNNNCKKVRFLRYYDAIEQATFDEQQWGDKRKVYYCWNCKAFHTSREKVNGDVPLLER